VIDLYAISQAAACIEPLPTSVARLAALVGSPAPDLAEIVDVVQFDQALTVALLRTANSSWSASRTKVTTIRDAVVRLGTGPILTLALGVQVRARLSGAIPEYGLDEGELWRHSVAASLAAETLTRFTTPRLPPETSTAALLHDIGKLVISRFLDPVELHAIEVAREAGVTRIQTESEVLGADHAELGALISQVWDLPEALVMGVAHHHDPARANSPLAYGVHLADVVAKAIGVGADDNADLESYSRSMGELGLSASSLDEVCGLVSHRFDEVSNRFN
jgi:putative nucleotidyltransferase with HDIG domain